MGKHTKQRHCPALGRAITPGDCGENRGSRYACPADCAFSPFASANYGQFGELEGAVDAKTLEWLRRHHPDPERLRAGLKAPLDSLSTHAFHSFLVGEIFHRTNAAGLTCAQAWERAGFPGLKNDERVLFRAKMQVRVALLEVRRVLDTERTEAVDLLADDGRVLLIRDRGLAAQAVRFSPCLSWVYPMPHYWRMHGGGISLPDFGRFTSREIVAEIAAHLGAPVDVPGLRVWLSDNFSRFAEALNAVSLARREQMFAGMDAKFGKAVYELRRPFAECRDVLDTAENVEQDDLTDAEMDEGFVEAYVWLGEDARLGAAFPKDAPQLLGRVLLGQSHCRVEAMGAERMARLRGEFEQLLGDRAKFTGERLDDLAVDFRARQPAFDRGLVPPRLLEEPQQVALGTARVPAPKISTGVTRAEMEAEIYAAQDRAWLDEPIPALDGRTPRAAARDAKLRPRLVALMKSRVRACDERNLAQGTDLDVNWMLRELGLDEILFDPPPFRPRPTAVFNDGDEVLEDAGEDDWNEAPRRLPMRPHLPPAPPLPPRPFTQAEIGGRMKVLLDEFELAEDAVDEMEDCGCTLLDVVDAATEGLLKGEQSDLLVPWLIQVWFLFVPPGTSGPALEVQRLQRAIEGQLEALTRLLQKSNAEREFTQFMCSGPQPDLSAFMVAQMIEATDSVPKKLRPQPETQAIMSSVLRAVIAELDAALRAR